MSEKIADNIIYGADFVFSFSILGGGMRAGKMKINVIGMTKTTQSNIMNITLKGFNTKFNLSKSIGMELKKT